MTSEKWLGCDACMNWSGMVGGKWKANIGTKYDTMLCMRWLDARMARLVDIMGMGNFIMNRGFAFFVGREFTLHGHGLSRNCKCSITVLDSKHLGMRMNTYACTQMVYFCSLLELATLLCHHKSKCFCYSSQQTKYQGKQTP